MIKIKGIVIFGEIGSGKDYISNMFIDKFPKGKHYNIGDTCRELMINVGLAKKMDEESTRVLGQNIGMKLREIDVNILNDYIYGKILNDYDKTDIKDKIYIISGGRTFEDLDYWKAKGFYTIGIKSTKSIEMAIIRDNSELKLARNHITELEVKKIISDDMCDELIENEHQNEVINSRIEEIIGKYLFKQDSILSEKS